MNAVQKPEQMLYQPATRKNVGVLVMLAGPSGSGKTLSALKLARGLAGPEGKIAVCDTEHDRALYYADQFTFHHHSLNEPFRPSRFEQAAVEAVRQKAAVWVCDSFSHEHVGPGGLLDFQQEEEDRMTARHLQRYPNDNEYEVRERMKARSWIEPKGEHKHMLQRLWQMNTHIVLCCHAEKKLLIQKVESGPRKGKTDFVDGGYQPVCGADIPYAMTLSFLFAVEKPGVPIVIKPMLQTLQPLIDLTRPLDEATGERIALWASGKTAAPANASQPETQRSAPPARPKPREEPAAATEAPSASEGASVAATEPRQPGAPPPRRRRTEADIHAGVEKLVQMLSETKTRLDHTAITDDPVIGPQITWLNENRATLYMTRVKPALVESWARTAPKRKEAA